LRTSSVSTYLRAYSPGSACTRNSAPQHIGPDIELINIDDINDAYDRIEKSEVRFRHVINMASLAPTDR